MSLFIASLNSGSNGNCYYVGNHKEAVLIDVGISCREIEKRMRRIGLSMDKVKAIFISHEHSDHIRGLEVTAKKFQLPVYITSPTLLNGRLKIESTLVRSFYEYEKIAIGELIVTPFPKLHDAADPFSFVVEHKDVRVGVLTDIGYNCRHLIKNFSQCHAVFLEENYDEKMLEEGGYPIYLQKRISSDKGHLSNDQSLELFTKYKADHLGLLILSHLSKNNNKPELVEELFKKHAGNTDIVVASRYKESAVYSIPHDPKKVVMKQASAQMSLF